MWVKSKSVIGAQLEFSIFILAAGVHNSQHCGGGGAATLAITSNHDGGFEILEDVCLKCVGVGLDQPNTI